MNQNIDESLTSKYWENIENGRLTRPVCNSCGKNFFSPQVLCPNCFSVDWSYSESIGIGKIYSHTTVYRPMGTGFPTPLILVDIELDEGWRMYSRLINCKPDQVVIGLDVEVIFEKFKERTLPFFQLRNEKI
ncbi:MAG: hypothetical protein CL431_08700 [Acidimicrobiaceae bacterium]|nr:hypothetical protein [Acidimicrobiaceae bacterium]